MTEANDIKTGIESDGRADPEAVNVEPDVWAFVDDGENAVTWAVERVDDGNVKVETHYHEAGLDEQVGEVRWFSIDPDETVDQWARKYAGSHVSSIEAAREYWNSGGDE